MTTTNTLRIGASLETLLDTGAIVSFADMCRIAAGMVALDNAIDGSASVVVDAEPASVNYLTVPSK